MFRLAELFVDISARDANLRKQVGGLKSELSAMGVAIGTAAGQLAASAIARATSALTGFISRGISGATNLAETISKVNAIFGDFGKDQIAGAEELAKAYGLPKQALLDAAASIGLVGKAAGQSQAEASQMAGTMAKLAADASSFYNVPLDVALEKIRAGLVGESEPLRAFGVLLSEEAVQAEAMALGLARSKKEIDDQAKVAARASLITKGLADASGDLERTAGSTANQWRKFTGTLENAATSIGESLAPAIGAVVTSLGQMATDVASAIEANKETIRSWAESVAGWIRSVPDAWDTFVAGLAVAFIKVDEFSQNTAAIFQAVAENAGQLGGWFSSNWLNLLKDGLSGAQTIFANLVTNLKDAWGALLDYFRTGTFNFNWTPLLDGFKAQTAELPELIKPKLVDMQGAIDAVGEDLNRKITDRAKAAAQASQAANAPAKAAADAAARKTRDFKSETLDTASYFDKLREAALGGGDDTPKKQLEEQTRTRVAAEKTAQLLGGGALVARFA